MGWRKLASEEHIYENTSTGQLMVRVRSQSANTPVDVKRKAKNLQHALDVRAEILSELSDSRTPKELISYYYNKIWKPAKETSVKSGTLKRYIEHIDAELMPQLGQRACVDIKRKEVIALRDNLAARAKRDGLRQATVDGYWRSLRLFLNDMSFHYEIRNPADGVSHKPAMHIAKLPKRWDIWTEKEYVGFLIATGQLTNLSDAAYIWMFASTGTLFSEVSPIKWDEVDFAGESIAIKRSQSSGDIGDRPKNVYRIRDMWLMPEVAAILKLLHDQYPKSEWAFPGRAGNFKAYGTSVQKSIKDAAYVSKLQKEATSKLFRKLLNSYALMKGLQEVKIKRAMGHSVRSGNMTGLYDIQNEYLVRREVQDVAVGTVIRDAGRQLGLLKGKNPWRY